MADAECLFCKISKGQIPAEKVYEDETVIGLRDIHPVAKIHLLFIHRHHSQDVNEMVGDRPKDLLEVFAGIKNYTEENGLDQKGFRVVTNLGRDGGQTIFHTHFHVLAGERLKWG